MLCRSWNFEVHCPILDKKDPPEDKELPDSSWPSSKVILSLSIASCNAEVTKVLKQVKQSVTKNHCMKLTPWFLHILINVETTHSFEGI